MLQAGVPEKEKGSINCEYSLFYLFTKGILHIAMSVVINFCLLTAINMYMVKEIVCRI